MEAASVQSRMILYHHQSTVVLYSSGRTPDSSSASGGSATGDADAADASSSCACGAIAAGPKYGKIESATISPFNATNEPEKGLHHPIMFSQEFESELHFIRESLTENAENPYLLYT